MACMECSNKDLLPPFNAIIGIEMQRNPKGVRMSCNSFHAIPTVWDLQSAQSPILAIVGPFWPFFGIPWPKFGTPPHRHTPNCTKTSARMSCNSFHAILTVWDHQSVHRQILAIFGPFWPFWGLLDQNWGDPCTSN